MTSNPRGYPLRRVRPDRLIDGRTYAAYSYQPRTHGFGRVGWLLGRSGRPYEVLAKAARLSDPTIDHPEYLVDLESGRRMVAGHIYSRNYWQHFEETCRLFGLLWRERTGEPTWREGTRLEVTVGPDGPSPLFELVVWGGKP